MTTRIKTLLVTLLLFFIATGIMAQRNGFKIAAYLVHDDGSISTFDILNDRSVVLWNVIGGGAEDGKSSNEIKIVLTGMLDSLKIIVKNGTFKPFIEDNIKLAGKIAFIVHNTGCEDVMITVYARNEAIYQGTIPFHCGE